MIQGIVLTFGFRGFWAFCRRLHARASPYVGCCTAEFLCCDVDSRGARKSPELEAQLSAPGAHRPRVDLGGQPPRKVEPWVNEELNIIKGAPDYNYSIMGPKTLFSLVRPLH